MTTLHPFADMYCWCCHLEDSMYKCKTCPRTYHRRCLMEMPDYPEPQFDPESMDPSSMEKCPECVAAEETILENMKNVTQSDLKSILRYVIENLKSNYFCFINFYDIPQPKHDTQSRAVLVKFMDIATLEKYVEEGVYQTLEAFFGDAKWIRHNIAVTKGKRSDEMIVAEKMMHVVASEMLAVDLCHECYIRKQNADLMDNWFIFTCSRPHLLGWAKTDNVAYWPVKIMGIDMGKQLAIVHSFWDHDLVETPLRNCLIYSENPPIPAKKLKGIAHGWKRACKEMRKHIELLEESHGKVVLAVEKIRVHCSITEAVQRMFPDWKLKLMNATLIRTTDSLESSSNVQSRLGLSSIPSDNEK